MADARPGIGSLEQWTGVNLERDVDDIVFATEDGSADAPSRPLLVLGGRFAARRVEAYAQDRGGQTEPYRDVQVVRAPPQIGDVAIAVTSPGLALLGDTMSGAAALDAKAGAIRAITDNVGFMNAAAGLDGSAAWSVATFNAVTSRTTLPTEVAAASADRLAGRERSIWHRRARRAASHRDDDHGCAEPSRDCARLRGTGRDEGAAEPAS